MKEFILVVLLFCCLPIWRIDGNREQGYNLYQFYKLQHTEEHLKKHIPIKEAKESARVAYLVSSSAT